MSDIKELNFMDKRKYNKGRQKKLNPQEEQSIYDQRIAGASIVELAYNNEISTRTVERIIKRIREQNENKN